jgi:hypothetical protein
MEQNAILEESKKVYIELLRSTNREGIENLITYLETKTDFFTAPASTRFHNNFEGGLLLHTLNVYRNFKKLLEARPDVQVDEENVIIAALCHDLCKANYYTKEERNRKVDGRWESYEVYSSIKSPSIPYPHATRSIRFLRSFISIKHIEELMIYYHMGPFGGEDYEYKNLLQDVNERYPATLLMYMADLMASYLDEEKRS